MALLYVNTSMQLNELFNDVYDYDLTKESSGWVATFTTSAARAKDRRDVSVEFDLLAANLGVYDLEFDVGGNFGITGGGDAIKIFGTVIAIARDFIKQGHPNALIYNAKDKSRKKLYARMTKKLCTLTDFVDMTAKLNALAKQEVLHVGAQVTPLDRLTYFWKRYQDITMEGYENTILVKKNFI